MLQCYDRFVDRMSRGMWHYEGVQTSHKADVMNVELKQARYQPHSEILQ